MPQPLKNQMLDDLDDSLAIAERDCGEDCNAAHKVSGEAFAEMVYRTFTDLCGGKVASAEISIDRDTILALCLMGVNDRNQRAMIVREIPGDVCMTHAVFGVLRRGVVDGVRITLGGME